MPTSIRPHSWLSLLLACAFCSSLVVEVHSQDEPAVKPLFPAPRLWKEYNGGVEIASISPDGKQVAVVAGLRGKTNGPWVFVYDKGTGKERYRFPALYSSSGFLGTVTFTPDGKRLVTVVARSETRRTEEQDARVTDAATGKLVRLIPLRAGQYMYVHTRYAVSDKVLVIAGTKEVATVYDLETGKELGNLPGDQRLESISLSRDGRWLLATDGGSRIHAWDVEKRTYFGKIHSHKSTIRSVAISPDGVTCAFVARADHHIYVIDRVSREEKAKCDVVFHAANAGRLRFTADGKTLVAGGIGPNYGLAFWDWKTSKEIRGGYPKGAQKFVHMRNPRGEEGRKAWRWGDVPDFSMSDDGKTIAFVPTSDKVNLWELISPEPPPKK